MRRPLVSIKQRRIIRIVPNQPSLNTLAICISIPCNKQQSKSFPDLTTSQERPSSREWKKNTDNGGSVDKSDASSEMEADRSCHEEGREEHKGAPRRQCYGAVSRRTRRWYIIRGDDIFHRARLRDVMRASEMPTLRLRLKSVHA